MKRVSYAMSADEKRYVLNGLLICLKEGKLTVVATDGRRLALADQELDFPKSGEREFILPAKAVHELQRLLGDKDDVSFAILENQILFSFGHTVIAAKMVEGNYPNYRQVIPAEAKERVTLERELFLNSVRRVALLSSEKTNSVKLTFGKHNLEIAANTPDVGEARDGVEARVGGVVSHRVDPRRERGVPDGNGRTPLGVSVAVALHGKAARSTPHSPEERRGGRDGQT